MRKSKQFLGLPRLPRLTKSACLRRAKEIERLVDRKKVPAKQVEKAKKYVTWYRCYAHNYAKKAA